MDSEFWLEKFDDRQKKQINWAYLYDTETFRHGDNGHNDKLIISKMRRMLEIYERSLKDAGINPRSLLDSI